MRYQEHCIECEQKLGKDWSVVHRWLDYFAQFYFPDPVHRVFRHHKEGIELVRKMWGDEAAKAAELHIIADEGYIPTQSDMDLRYAVNAHSKEILLNIQNKNNHP
jgi:hypothetical protein